MSIKAFLFALAIISCLAHAQTVDEYCANEKATGEECYMQCCESMGYAWGGSGCLVTDEEGEQVSQQCMYCVEDYVACRDYYESGGANSSSGGCCAGAILPAVLGLSAIFLQRRESG